jgi:hypothetical protein
VGFVPLSQSQHGRDGRAPFFCREKSYFKETLVYDRKQNSPVKPLPIRENLHYWWLKNPIGLNRTSRTPRRAITTQENDRATAREHNREGHGRLDRAGAGRGPLTEAQRHRGESERKC